MINGRVAQVLNERELVINRGLEHGVTRGMKFDVLSGSPVTIIDPEDSTELGTVDRPKVKVQAVDVQKKFSICTTFEIRRVRGGAWGDASIARLFEPDQTETVTLKARDSAFPQPLTEEESYVKVGDRVRQIEEVVQQARVAGSIAAAS